jgi:ATP-dependent DNA helicase RecG
MRPSTPIEKVAGIGPFYQKRLKKLGIETINDLLHHFPHRYEDFSNLISISQVKLGEKVCIKGKILEIKNNKTWAKKMILTQAVVQDESSAIKAVWFNQPYLIKALKPGEFVYLAGKIALGKATKKSAPEIYLANPVYEKINEEGEPLHLGRLVPIYPETSGISSRWLRYLIKKILSQSEKEIIDPLPEKIRKKEDLPPLPKAFWQIHFPESLPIAQKAKNRFAFEEIFKITLLTLRERIRLNKKRAFEIPLNLEIIKKFVNALPFKLTDGQKKSLWQILKDLEKPRPMNRLLEGDVGSGKTVVATGAALNTVKAGYQVAFMAPTEILSKQHFQELTKLLKNFNVNIGLLTGKEDKLFSKKLKNSFVEISRQKLLEQTKNGQIDILVGTHALIQEKVEFSRLALVILDEQHRFGVEQRARLSQKASQKNNFIPHLLSMTATPIPRTLALTLYGDLDISLIPELPKGRKKIITKIIPPEKRKKAYEFIRKEVKKGRRVFVICPRIEAPQESEENAFLTEIKAVKKEYEKLSQEIFPDLKIAMMHGKLKSKEKEKIMKDFKSGKINVLVSTSVVEVGIDVPEATVMMIEGAERFGLAQLHQFRGRVGRSKFQSYCFLFTESQSQRTRKRLEALLQSSDGFTLAQKDLELRGPGDLVGKRQWGFPDLAMASLKDILLVEKAREAAKEILEEDPELKKYPLLKKEVEEFREKIHLE